MSGDDPLIESGVLTVRKGMVVSITKRQFESVLDLGDVCLLPGFINSHTHLEFSYLQSPISTQGGFAAWIRRVVQHRRELQNHLTPLQHREERKRAWQTGLMQSAQFGVRGLIDMITPPWAIEFVGALYLKENQAINLWVLAEQMDVTADRRTQSESFGDQTESECTDPIGMVRAGLSPHAPYTVSIGFLLECIQKAKRYKQLTSIHLAESREEIEWLERGTGPLADMLSEVKGRVPAARSSLADYVRAMATADMGLIVHGNYLDHSCREILMGARDRLAVVYCPRTHAAFEHDPHPVSDLLRQGIKVFLGTDSLASNPDLSILEEARFLYQRHPGLGAENILRMITVEPASFLGCSKQFTQLVGKPFQSLVSVPCTTNDPKMVCHSILDRA